MSELIHAEAADFYKKGMEQLDLVLVNEHEAKEAMLLAMVSPSEGPTGVTLLGGTGGGKTTLLDRAHLLIEGVGNEHVAELPPQSDLRPVEIIGGRVRSSVTTESEKAQVVETKTQDIAGLITQDTKVIKLNEIDTINPQSLNAIREALAAGYITNTEGTVALGGLLYFVSNKNPRDNKGKFEVSDAMASRHAIGAYLGYDTDMNVNTVEQILGGFRPASKIDPVIDIETILAIKEHAGSNFPLAESLKKESAVKLVAVSKALLRVVQIDDTPQRLAVQVVNTARALAVLKAEKMVEREHVEQATRLAVTARVGLRGTNKTSSIQDLVDEIVTAG